MAIDNSILATCVYQNARWIENTATQLYISQWASAASAAQNPKEQAEYAKIAEAIQYRLILNGSSLSLSKEEKKISPYIEIIEEGMDAPLSGGSGGLAKNPDGTMYASKVPVQLWGTEIPEYAKEPNPVSEGIHSMLMSLVPEWINDTCNSCKPEIAEILKPEIMNILYGGAS